MKSKRRIILSTVILIACILIGYLYFQNYVKIQNVFDQMYYTRVRNQYDWFGDNRSTLFDNMEQLKNISKDAELYSTQEGLFKETYKEEYLEKNQSINLYFSEQEKNISMVFKIEFPEDNERIWIEYSYNIETRELIKKPLSIVSSLYDSASQYNTNLMDINNFLSRHNFSKTEVNKLYNYFLFDRILKDWFDTNDSNTRFSIDNLGKYKFVDNKDI